jgi:hypothetical protein
MLKSGAIEYKDGEFTIHKEKVDPEESPPAPDISPTFQREKISLEEVKRELSITDTPTTPHEKAIHAHTAKQKSDLESPPSDPREEQTEKSTPEENQQAHERPPVTFIVLGLIVFCIIVVVVYRNRNKKR